jgi:hypothetical protein
MNIPSNAGLPAGQSPALLSASSGQTGGMHTPQVLYVWLRFVSWLVAPKPGVGGKHRSLFDPGCFAAGITPSPFRSQVSGLASLLLYQMKIEENTGSNTTNYKA